MPSLHGLFKGFHSLGCYSYAPYPSNAVRDGSTGDWDLWWLVQAFKREKNQCKIPGTGTWVDPAQYIAASLDEKCCAQLAGRSLVPVPGHAVTPPNPEARSWPGLRMAIGLAGRFGNPVVIALRRTMAIQQSTQTKALSERASVDEQVRSLSVDLSGLGDQVLLVDDTLTSGTTCMGCYQALRRAGYTGDVSAFTIGHVLSSKEEPRAFHVRSAIHWSEGGRHATRM